MSMRKGTNLKTFETIKENLVLRCDKKNRSFTLMDKFMLLSFFFFLKRVLSTFNVNLFSLNLLLDQCWVLQWTDFRVVETLVS